MTYAGFWRRFGAFWLDFLVLLPLIVLNLWGVAHHRLFSAYKWLLGLAGSIALIAATVAMSDADYDALPGIAAKNFTSVMPRWQYYTTIAFQIWIWSEFVVMMTNRKRRAIHDLIAGTIVIVERRSNPIAAPTSTTDPA